MPRPAPAASDVALRVVTAALLEYSVLLIAALGATALARIEAGRRLPDAT